MNDGIYNMCAVSAVFSAGLWSLLLIHCKLIPEMILGLFECLTFDLEIFIECIYVFMCVRYASIGAIETKSRADDRQWLTYWVLYSLITLFELTFWKALEW